MTRRIAALIVALVVAPVILGVVWYFTWHSIEEGQRIGTWSYSQLFTSAQEGQVITVTITGDQAVATDRRGQKHYVMLSPDPSADARALTADGVDVSFHESPSGAYWAQVLIPNLILLLLFGAGGYGLYRLLRRRT